MRLAISTNYKHLEFTSKTFWFYFLKKILSTTTSSIIGAISRTRRQKEGFDTEPTNYASTTNSSSNTGKRGAPRRPLTRDKLLPAFNRDTTRLRAAVQLLCISFVSGFARRHLVLLWLSSACLFPNALGEMASRSSCCPPPSLRGEDAAGDASDLFQVDVMLVGFFFSSSSWRFSRSVTVEVRDLSLSLG